MKVFIPAYFITSGHSVQKWKGTDMESMRDTKRIMEREIKKGSTPLSFEQMEIDTNNYQEITSVEKLTQVLQYLHRVGNYKSLAGKTVINNVYTFMRGRTPDFTRARSIFDREKIYHQMLRQERKMKPTDSNIKSFERVARKYNVDFAVKKDKTMEPPKYLVFFKGKDADVIAQAFKEFVKVNEKKQQRPSLRQKLKGLQKMIAQNKNRERSREKNKDRGQSL